MKKHSQFAIELNDVRKSFGDLKVLEGINLKVPRGKILALLGPNGAGKTTTVRMLSTLLKPDSGELYIEGHNVVTEAHKVRSVIGLTGQYAAVDEYLTGEENIIMMGQLYHLGKKESVKRAHELLKQFDLVDSGKRVAKTYSGGMKRRLDLALSLVATPPILFLDEPTTGLDPRSRIAMWNVIERLRKDGSTILLTTQYLEEADQLADRVAVIDHGRVIAEGTPNELKVQVGSDHLELMIKNSHDAEKAREAVGQGTVTPLDNHFLLSVPLKNTVHDVKVVLDHIERIGISIESLSIKKPTLDDVFMKITGHGASVNEK